MSPVKRYCDPSRLYPEEKLMALKDPSFDVR